MSMVRVTKKSLGGAAMKVALQYQMGDTAGVAAGSGYNRGNGHFDLMVEGYFDQCFAF